MKYIISYNNRGKHLESMMGQETSAKLEENSINKIKNQRDEELNRMDKESPKRKQETKC